MTTATESTPEGPWYSVLPEPYRLGLDVVLILAPPRGIPFVDEKMDGTRLWLMKTSAGRSYRGIQVMQPRLDSRQEQADFFEAEGVKMLPAKYIGPIDRLPQKLLLQDGVPLLFLAQAMWRPFLNLRAYLKEITETDDN